MFEGRDIISKKEEASENESSGVRLYVEKVYPSDEYGKGVILLTQEIMDTLGISAGDAVEIEGERKTVAKVWKANILDCGDADAVGIDTFIRSNAKVSLGDTVTIRKTQAVPAKTVTLAPLEGENIVITPEIAENIIYNIRDRFVVKGDIIPVRRDVIPTVENMSAAVKKQNAEFVVTQATPSRQTLLITADTVVSFEKEAASGIRKKGVSFDDIGALDRQLREIRDAIEIPIKQPALFKKLRVEPPKGLILYGIPGTGKTMIARAVADEIGANFYYVAGPEIVKSGYGQSEEAIRNLFAVASQNAPSIIFIDEIDSIAPKREESPEVERRIVSQLLTMMDGMLDTTQVFIVGATNRINAIDPALRRPGRFDREIEINAPDRAGREEILNIHARLMPLEGYADLRRLDKMIRLAADARDRETHAALLEEKQTARQKYDENVKELFSSLAARTQGFVGADLAALCREAALNTIRRITPDLDLDAPLSEDILENLSISNDDFEQALKKCEPSALREIAVEIPAVSWEDVGGLDDVRQEIVETVEWPLKYPEKFERFGIEPPTGILLYGPPGTGKTLLAQAVAHESEASFISVKSTEFLAKWVGDSEKAIKEVFRKARHAAPTIIFFDEIDAFASVRGSGSSGTRSVTESILNQMLVEMDGIDRLKDVFVIAATNRPEEIDPALRRPGRLDRMVYVKAPDKDGRKHIFDIYLKNIPVQSDVSSAELALKTDGYTGADIEAVCREAVMISLRDDFGVTEIGMDAFWKALDKVPPTVSKDVADRFDRIEEQLRKKETMADDVDPYMAYR